MRYKIYQESHFKRTIKNSSGFRGTIFNLSACFPRVAVDIGIVTHKYTVEYDVYQSLFVVALQVVLEPEGIMI
jgi:hypothetical protein